MRVRVACMMVALSGCSLAFVEGPPAPCSTSYAAPVVEGAFAMLSVGAAIASFTESCRGRFCGLQPIMGYTYVTTAVLLAASAAIGARRVSRCRDDIEAARQSPPSEAERQLRELIAMGTAAAARGDCSRALAVAHALESSTLFRDYVGDPGVVTCLRKTAASAAPQDAGLQDAVPSPPAPQD